MATAASPWPASRIDPPGPGVGASTCGGTGLEEENPRGRGDAPGGLLRDPGTARPVERADAEMARPPGPRPRAGRPYRLAGGRRPVLQTGGDEALRDCFLKLGHGEP